MMSLFSSFLVFLFLSTTIVNARRKSKYDCDVVASSAFNGESEIDYVTTSSGASLEVQIFNRKKLNKRKTPLFFIHGGLQSRQTWGGTLQCLDITNRAILVPSLRGHGDSQIFPANSNFTLQEFVSDLIDVLDYYEIESAIWIGHSLGSVVSYNAASNNNGLIGSAANSASYVESVVLVGTTKGGGADVCAGIDGLVSLFEPICSRDFLTAYSQFSGSLAAANDVRLTNQYLRETWKCPYDILVFLLDDLCGYDAITNGVFAGITQKVTILYGTNDFVADLDEQNDIVNAMVNAESVDLVQFDGIGHEIFWEVVEDFRDALEDAIL